MLFQRNLLNTVVTDECIAYFLCIRLGLLVNSRCLDICGRSSKLDDIVACWGLPLIGGLIEGSEFISAYIECQGLALTRLEKSGLTECLEFLLRLLKTSRRSRNIYLNGLLACDLASVGDCHRSGETVLCSLYNRLAVCESGIRKTESERIGNLLVSSIEIPVTYPDTLFVIYIVNVLPKLRLLALAAETACLLRIVGIVVREVG